MDDEGNVNGVALDNTSAIATLSCPALFRLCSDSYSNRWNHIKQIKTIQPLNSMMYKIILVIVDFPL